LTDIKQNLGIYFGSQTGNAEMLALDVSALAPTYGFKPSVAGLDEISLEDFTENKFIIICCSTWGDGEQPDNAQEMFDLVNEVDESTLQDVQFAVLGLGDTAFDLFCESAKEWDVLLEEKGGTRNNARIECDVDYEDEAEDWIVSTLESMKEVL